MEAGAQLEQRPDAPADLDTAGTRLDDPGDQAQQRRLAGAVAADQTDCAAGSTSKETSRSAITSAGRERRRATTRSLSRRASRGYTVKRRDACSTRSPRDGSRLRGYRQRPPNQAGEHLHERRIRVRHLDPAEAHPQLRTLSAASWSRSSGSRGDRRRSRPGRRGRLSRPGSGARRGDRGCRGEPGLARRRFALERERPVRQRSSFGHELRGLEQLLAIRVACLEDARREGVRREHDVRARASHAVREHSTNPARLPALDEGQLGPTPSASSSCRR